MDQAVSIARQSELVVAAVGFNELIEGEGMDRQSFKLPYQQAELLNKLFEVNKNVVILLYGGGPSDISEWKDKAAAVLYVGYPGQQGAGAIANILSGNVCPSGKLPFTWIKNKEQNPVFKNYYKNPKEVVFSEGIFMGYRYIDKNNLLPEYPFGFGLSYTTFDYNGLEVNRSNDTVEVSFIVKNTGLLKGAEVVQVYVSDVESELERPLKELKAFERIELAPEQETKVKIKLTPEDFKYYNDTKHEWVLEPGEFIIKVGSSSTDIKLKSNLIL